jgi:bifunctional non-homologous end joining protein LigD
MRAYTGRRSFEIKDPIVEPLWSGTRALAHVTVDPEAEPPARVRLIEQLGADLSDELPALIEALAEGVLAREAIVDGVITRQLALDGVGAAAIPEVRGRPGEMLIRGNVDLDVRPDTATLEQAAAGAEGFVAVDLLHIDGTSLLDVPLLERKRLLEGVISPGPALRVSSHVRPPVDPWVATWRSVGLAGAIVKAANSRYHPSGDTVEWRVVKRLGGRR